MSLLCIGIYIWIWSESWELIFQQNETWMPPNGSTSKITVIWIYEARFKIKGRSEKIRTIEKWQIYWWFQQFAYLLCFVHNHHVVSNTIDIVKQSWLLSCSTNSDDVNNDTMSKKYIKFIERGTNHELWLLPIGLDFT